MVQAATRTATTRWLRLAGSTLVLALLAPATAGALTSPSLRDLADPVAPGGILPYRITLANVAPTGPEGPPPPFCFNPPGECIPTPVTCSNPLARCVGNETAGFVCQDSLNDLANCGEGIPPVPNDMLCISRDRGVCNGGNHVGLACFSPDGQLTAECPGTTFFCRRSVNEGEYCGTTFPRPPQCLGDPTTGFFCVDAANEGAPCGTQEEEPEPDPSLCQEMDVQPPRPENGFCLSRPTGICSGGPNVGLVCDTPHGEPSVQCPPTDPGMPPPAPTNVTVDLPILTGMSFMDADNGGTSNGTTITWTVPPLTTCGGANQPRCPQLNARLLIDPLVPEGTVYQNFATATDQDGFLVSGPQLTTIARFLLRNLALSYPLQADDRDRFAYRTLFSLLATESIDPGNEAFGINVANPTDGTIVDFQLAPGQLQPNTVTTWAFRSRLPGLKAVTLRQIAPGHYGLRVRAAQLTLPNITNLNVTVTLTLGDDTLTHDARLLVKRGGRRYVAARSTTTTSIVSAPTTTTSVTTSTVFGATTTSTSTTLDTTTTSTTSTTDTSTTSTTSTTDTSTTSTTSTTDTSTTSSTSTTDTSTTTSTTDTSTTTSSSSTTSTTIACGDSAPACDGFCPVGTCADVAGVCTCLP